MPIKTQEGFGKFFWGTGGRRREGLFGALLAGVLAGGAGAVADVDEAAVLELDPFAVEAFALPFSVEDFAGAGALLTGEALRETGAGDLAEALRAAANLPLQSFSGSTATATVDLRGYGENGGLRTLIMVDGQPLNRADMGSPSWLEIPLGEVARVEILRGPQSARFGDFAVGGVINIVTRLDPGAAPRTQLEAAGGSYESWTGRLHHRRPWAGGALALGADATGTEGYRENSGYEARSGSVSFARTEPGGATWRVNVLALEDRVEFPGALSSAPGGGFPQRPRASQYGDLAEGYFSENNKLSLSFALAVPGKDEDGRAWDVRGGANRRSLQWNFGAGSHADTTQGQVRLNLEHTIWRGSRWSGTAGITGSATRLDYTSFLTFAREEVLSRADLAKDSGALYLSLEGRLGERWTLTAVARGEAHRIAGENRDERNAFLDFDDATTNRGFAAQVGLQWRPASGRRAWLRYDRLYRFPVVDEIAAYQRIGLSVPFNREIGPEVGHNLECGGEWSGPLGTVGMNLFGQRLNGEIGYDFVLNRNANLYDSRRLGAELSWHGQWRGWDARLAYTRINARIVGEGPNTGEVGSWEGKAVPLVASDRWSAVLITPSWARLRLTGEVLSQGSAPEGGDFANRAPPLPGWTLLNLALRLEWSSAVSAYFRLNNVFDRDYATLKFAQSWYPAPGRHARAGVQFEF